MRDKTIRELQGRYDEAVRFTSSPPINPEDYNQLLTVIAHYAQYTQENSLTKSALKKLLEQKTVVHAEQSLLEEADQIIGEVRTDLSRMIRMAKRHKISTNVLDTLKENGQLTTSQGLRLYIGNVQNFLDQDLQYISDVPKYLGYMQTIAWDLKSLNAMSDRTLKPIINKYRNLQDDYARKLKRQTTYKSFIRLDDYNAIEDIRKYIYNEATTNEALLFLMMNDDLIDHSNTKPYIQKDKEDALTKLNEYTRHLQRLHNHLLTELENVPRSERFSRWIIEHFGPTLVSILVIVLIWALLWRLGLQIDLNTLKDWIL